MVKFEWDENKNKINTTKHNVSFEEAITVFYDDNAIVITDDNHLDAEDRFIIIGCSTGEKLLVVCHCYRDSGNIIRVISARKATKSERKQYEDKWE